MKAVSALGKYGELAVEVDGVEAKGTLFGHRGESAGQLLRIKADVGVMLPQVRVSISRNVRRLKLEASTNLVKVT
jgi:hypothetical protein